MKLTFVTSLFFLFWGVALSAQDQHEGISTLESQGVELDMLDKAWLSDNTSFLIDMSTLVQMDTTAMNKAIIQMSTKLLSNELIEITEEESRMKEELITEIIYGALDHHGLESEKMLSAMSWYNMIVKEIGI